MSPHTPVPQRIKFFSTGTFILLGLMGVGFAFGLARFLTGLEPLTNLSNYYPWGIWIAIDVACGVALAAGGFTTAAIAEIFGGKKFHPLVRPAILTAWLGYAMVAFGLTFDLGRYWNIWRPAFNWQGNSALFEVAMCVMGYLTVLTFEMAPSILEGLKRWIDEDGWGAAILTKLERPIMWAHSATKTALPLFIIAGVVLSCMHQSSLGTIMVLVPTKLNPLWYTPLLPLLFLLSAVMVGFPMVVFESLLASRSFRREPEMDLLSPLARYIPWFIGVYAFVKFLDLYLRRADLCFLSCPGPATAFTIEVGVGIILPFLLLSSKTLRRSPGWLFFGSFCVILGVVLNRINVYLVGFNPPYATSSYFPAIGEIAVTVAIICLLMLLYRFFVAFFPILPGIHTSTAERRVTELEPALSSTWAWVIRAAAVGLLLTFVLLYALVHKEAVAGEISAFKWANRVVPVKHAPEPTPPTQHAFRPEGYKNLYILNNDLLNSKTDFYEPVKFTHRSHDAYTDGDCGVCHHRFSFDESDRVGEDIKELHESFDVTLSGPCSGCHDMSSISILKCATCHWVPNEEDDPNRLGLKGAYHRQCIGCHEDHPNVEYIPTDCITCHHPYTPDHRGLVEVQAGTGPFAVTAACLQCHESTGQDILKTAHWRWGGHSPTVKGHKHSTNLGKATVLNNYCIGVSPNFQVCATCHIGYGWVDESFNFDDPSRIDCLVCHDTTGKYAKDPASGGMPDASVDLTEVAYSVGRPSRKTCGLCHFYSGNGPNYKHGDLEPILVDPPDDFDIHMGRYDMLCQDCHKTESHRIAGSSMSAPAVEGMVFCEVCHGEEPHRITGILGRHLDDHVKAVSCETCHIPYVAKDLPTRVFLDYSKAGQDRSSIKMEYGQPTYDKKFGEMRWKKDLVPQYRWYNHDHEIHTPGEKINPRRVVELNTPLGERQDPHSRIYPFKIHTTIQPYDVENKILAVPKLFNGYWEHFDWNQALKEGMEAAGLTFSGSYDFVETRMYTSLHHEVVPAKQALGCTDCHATPAVTCTRCHSRARGMAQPEHMRRVYPNLPRFLDFKVLGYEDDPALIGGRFYTSLGRGRPPQ
ncbi:MAG TPA: Ni/Fe-hydrogenase cytochrome b subunit [Thermoanaerobaculia bacterium]|nr:Ni/Fe-hydrogenase cytochrome b subunit [Thermoanaerobaculia bacterium]HUM28566.1 Ni/Fe-hydrogenase cytochrome b subunit [Thermoanaerobaculia bacterium]HXK66826.1 Ni/Fe-hydrogenase cytochrome b subunit [Thermoanaerobaculia bacterium]